MVPDKKKKFRLTVSKIYVPTVERNTRYVPIVFQLIKHSSFSVQNIFICRNTQKGLQQGETEELKEGRAAEKPPGGGAGAEVPPGSQAQGRIGTRPYPAPPTPYPSARRHTPHPHPCPGFSPPVQSHFDTTATTRLSRTRPTPTPAHLTNSLKSQGCPVALREAQAVARG